MSNTIITPSIVAKEAVMLLDNNLVFGNRVYRGYEDEFAGQVNGYKKGSSLTIRKPTQFTVGTTTAVTAQDVTEGSTSITVNSLANVSFKFSSQELTQSIGELSDRVIKPAMIQIANKIDRDVAAAALQYSWNWTGTPGSTINAWSSFGAGVQRLDEGDVPNDGERSAVLSPADKFALLGAQTGVYVQDVARPAWRNADLGPVAGVPTYGSQNVASFTTGARGGTPLVDGASQNVTYGSSNSWGTSQTLNIKGGSNSITGWAKAGDVFTIAGVYAINPVTKVAYSYLQQFVITADANTNGSGLAALTISPAIITSGAFQTVSAAPADGAAITMSGSAATSYTPSLMFHRNAIALACVPLEIIPGMVDPGRETYKGLSVRVVPFYDGTNDIGQWRLDVLYGVKVVDPRLISRVSR